MRVIKYGEGYSPVHRKVECFECRSILEFTDQDKVEYTNNSYLQCPVCGEMMGWYNVLNELIEVE